MSQLYYLPLATKWERRGVTPFGALCVNAGLGVFSAAVFLFGAWQDGTLHMPGRSFGLLEHPAIWIFLAAQIFVPVAVSRAVARFKSLDKEPGVPLSDEFIKNRFPSVRDSFLSMLRRSDRRAGRIFNVLLFLGLAFWTWNTLQNIRIVPSPRFDFWDSAAHPWGYWSSRVYKLYIWLALAPWLVHAQLCITRATRRMLRRVTTAGALVLDPYHPDGAGGTRSFINKVLLPMFALVIPAVMLATAATWVHERYDVTTVGAITATTALFILIYWYPAISLRNAIIAEKDRQKHKISGLQRSLYDSLLNEKPVATTLKDPTSVLLSLSAVSKQVDSLPNWPQLTRVVQTALVFIGSPLVAPLVKEIPKQLQSWFL